MAPVTCSRSKWSRRVRPKLMDKDSACGYMSGIRIGVEDAYRYPLVYSGKSKIIFSKVDVGHESSFAPHLLLSYNLQITWEITETAEIRECYASPSIDYPTSLRSDHLPPKRPSVLLQSNTGLSPGRLARWELNGSLIQNNQLIQCHVME